MKRPRSRGAKRPVAPARGIKYKRTVALTRRPSFNQKPAQVMTPRRMLLIALLLLALALAWTRDRARPFVGHHDYDNILWVSAAENYTRYGLWETRLQPITDPVARTRAAWTVNLHHPPGIALLTYAGREAFGGSEFAARLWPLGASLVTAALVFRLARRSYGPATAALGLALFGFTPLMIYYSGKIGHEQATLPLMLAALLAVPPPAPHTRSRSRADRLGLLVIGAAGAWMSWAWFLFLALLVAYGWRTQGWRGVRRLGALWTGGAIGGASLLLVMAWQQPDFAATLRAAFVARTTGDDGTVITLADWIGQVGPTLLWLPTPVVTAFALIGLADRTNRARGLLAVPALTAALYGLVFWRATYYHDYLISYAVPALSLWAAAGFRRAWTAYGQPPRRSWAIALGLVLVTFAVSSARGAIRLYHMDTYPERHSWGIQAGAATQPGEIIASNLPDIGPHIGYYARRLVRYDQPPDLVPTRPADWGFYILVVEPGSAPPAWLDTFPYTYDPAGKCYLIDLKP